MQEVRTYFPECNSLYSDMLFGTDSPKSCSPDVTLILWLKPLKNLRRQIRFPGLAFAQYHVNTQFRLYNRRARFSLVNISAVPPTLPDRVIALFRLRIYVLELGIER